MATYYNDQAVVDHDPVNHPAHYQGKNGMEVIDVIEAFTEGLNGIEATDTGNIIKYACRWKKKNGIEDLKKAVFYANHLINHLEEKRTDDFFAAVHANTAVSRSDGETVTAHN